MSKNVIVIILVILLIIIGYKYYKCKKSTPNTPAVVPSGAPAIKPNNVKTNVY